MRTVRLHFPISLLLATMLLPLQTFAAEAGSPSVGPQMDAINGSIRRLNRQIADPAQKATSLELVATIQKNAETAKTLTPSKAATMTGDEKAKYIATFQKDIDALLKEIGVLKVAIAADKTDDAKAALQKIGDLRNSSHQELGVDMGRGGRRGGPRGGEGQQPPPPPPNQ